MKIEPVDTCEEHCWKKRRESDPTCDAQVIFQLYCDLSEWKSSERRPPNVRQFMQEQNKCWFDTCTFLSTNVRKKEKNSMTRPCKQDMESIYKNLLSNAPGSPQCFNHFNRLRYQGCSCILELLSLGLKFPDSPNPESKHCRFEPRSTWRQPNRLDFQKFVPLQYVYCVFFCQKLTSSNFTSHATG